MYPIKTLVKTTESKVHRIEIFTVFNKIPDRSCLENYLRKSVNFYYLSWKVFSIIKEFQRISVTIISYIRNIIYFLLDYSSLQVSDGSLASAGLFMLYSVKALDWSNFMTDRLQGIQFLPVVQDQQLNIMWPLFVITVVLCRSYQENDFLRLFCLTLIGKFYIC